MDAKDIIAFANDIKNTWETNDPMVIAERLGIHVLVRKANVKGFKAHTIQMEGYPTVISVNAAYTPESRVVLCAHELGHALLHQKQLINYFDNMRAKDIHSTLEYEANLFAVALLSTEVQYNIPLHEMSGSVLKHIVEYNLRTKKQY